MARNQANGYALSTVRPIVFATLLSLASVAATTFAPAPAVADFDPTGRGKKPKPGPTKPKPDPSTKPKPKPDPGTKPKPDPGTKPDPATKPDPGKADPGTKPDPGAKPGKDGEDGGDKGRSSDALILRYTGALLSQPSAPFPLQRLAQLYRERDGNLKKLVEDFEKRAGASGDEAWAARVALAGIYKQDGRADDAVKTYEAAIADKPKDAAPLVALAQLEADRGNKKEARADYEKALPLLKAGADVEQTTRILMGLAIDLKDFDAAKKFHNDLVAKSQGSLFVKAELGRELFARQEYAKAEGEFRDLVKAAAGDNRALAPALKDLGSVLAKEKKTDEALEVLKKALAVAGSAAGIRAEVMAIMTEAFRSEGKLAELIEILEKEPGSDGGRLATLGSLYEETGNVDKALAAYRKALGSDSRSVDVRVKLVHLLQTAGQLEEAIKEYEGLIKAAPNSPDYVFELCETLIQRGDRPKALALLKELEGRSSAEGDVLAAIADFYERVEEKDRAMAVLQRLANTANGDPTFLVDLGDRYYQAGDKKKALETWARIKTLVPQKAKADSTLGEVYLDHDMPEEALAALREAVSIEPQNSIYKKSLAIALERTAPGTPSAAERFNEAVALWQELLKAASNPSAGSDKNGGKKDDNLAREARVHIVSLWSVTKELASKVAPLKARFEGKPPDLEAGRLLAEVHRKLNKLPEAEAVLRSVVAKAPGDEQSLLALEHLLVQEQNLAAAIEVLQKLADLNPKAARQYYQRMGQYAAELYHDDDAIKYTAKAVDLSPEDANGHQKLGDMYRKRQDYEKAIAEYRQAIAKNDRLFPVYFDLAELLLSSGNDADADLLFRKVVRSAPDEELVSRAARMSMQINLGKGSLETLERELLPVAVGNPHKPIYRRLLVELYGAMTLPLVQKVRSSDGTPEGNKQADEARAKLTTIGTRAVKPLLDALSDDKESQQRVAIEVLAYVANKNAGPSLFNFATSPADKALRVRAMIACGALRDDALLPKFESLLAPKDGGASLQPSDEIALAASWGVARIRGEKAEGLLVKLLDSPSPDVRSIAAVGLGLSKNRRHLPRLLKIASSQESGPLPRSAALIALSELVDGPGELSRERSDVLALASAATFANDASLKKAGLMTSARLLAHDTRDPRSGSTSEAIASSVFAGDPDLREGAVRAASVLFAKRFTRTHDPLPVPDGALRAADVIASLDADAPSLDARVQAFVAMEADLARAATAAVATSPERATTVADALAGTLLSPFASSSEAIPAELAAKSAPAMSDLRKTVVPGFVALVHHPDVDMRVKAIEVLAKRSEPEAEAAMVDALRDPEDRVRRAVLSAYAAGGAASSDQAADAISKLAKESKDWALRVRAAEAMGRVGKGAQKERTLAALASLARTDPYALVRESAVKALGDLDPKAGESVLRELAKKDSEPRVRAAARAVLDGKKSE